MVLGNPKHSTVRWGAGMALREVGSWHGTAWNGREGSASDLALLIPGPLGVTTLETHACGRSSNCLRNSSYFTSKAPTRVRLLNVCVWPVLDSIFQIIRPVCRESHCFCIHARHAGRWSTPSKPRSQKLPRRSSKQMIMSWGWDMLYTGGYEMRCRSVAMWIGLAIIIYRSKTCTQSTPLKKICDFYPVRTNLHPSQYICSYFSACRTNPQGQNALRTAPRD